MISGLGLVCVWVNDLDEAKEFYVDKLGCDVNMDAEVEGMRWLLVTPPNQPDVLLMLVVPGPPVLDEQTAASIRTLMAKGILGPGGFVTDDCRASYAELKDRGVEFTGEPEDRFYGIDAGFRDPSGNEWRLTQVKPVPVGA